MLSQQMTQRLNEQINLEVSAALLYWQMSSWCAHQSLEGCATFLRQHADEEMSHMRRLMQYLHETGALAVIGGVEAPPTEFTSVVDVFERIYQQEQKITQKINDLVHLATTEPDYSTLNFLQWYVAEQHQEEFLFQSILDKIKLIGVTGQGLFFIDREMGELARRRKAKQ